MLLRTVIIRPSKRWTKTILTLRFSTFTFPGRTGLTLPDTYAVFEDGTNNVTGASFMALTKPEFRFYTANIDEQTAYDYNQAGVTATMANGGDTLNARFVKKADGNVLLEVTGITAENMDKTVTVTVTGLGDITFNGNAFAKAMASSSNTAQQNLGAALYNYSAAANACWLIGT